MEREEKTVAVAAGQSASGRLDEVYSDERGVIADGDTRWLADLFFVATNFRLFSDGIVDLLFVEQPIEL